MLSLPRRPRYAVSSASDRGEGPVSYIAVALLVSLLVGALVVTNVPVTVASAIKTAVCKVAAGSWCDTPEKAAEGRGTSGGGRPVTVAAPQNGGQKKDDGNCWSWADWACGAVDGLRLGSWDVIKDTWDGITFTGCLVHICSHDGFTSNWSSIGALFTTDPRETGKAILDEATKPIRDDWNNGHKVRAVFRAIPTTLGVVFGGKGLTKLKNLKGKNRSRGKDKEPDPPARLDAPEVIERRAEEAGRRGDVEGAEEALEDAEQHRRELLEAAEKDQSKVSMGERAKAQATVRAAKRAVADAKVRKVLMRTPTGRWANDILNRYNVEVRYESDGGSYYIPTVNQIHVSTSKGGSKPKGERSPEDVRSPESLAVILVHEANHVEYEHTGRVPPRTVPRDKYLKSRVREEAEGTAREVEQVYELRPLGVKVGAGIAEDIYDRGYHRARRQAIERGEKLTEAELHEIGRKGAVDALEEAFHAGRFRTSNTGETYPDYYGKYWDQANGWSKPPVD